MQKTKKYLKDNSTKQKGNFKTMINKVMDGLHSALESPIPRLPDKPCLPRVKINNDKSYTKRNHLNKPYNRQAVVGLRRALVSHKNYLSQMKPNTKSYLTNFSSVYSPGSDIMSS